MIEHARPAVVTSDSDCPTCPYRSNRSSPNRAITHQMPCRLHRNALLAVDRACDASTLGHIPQRSYRNPVPPPHNNCKKRKRGFYSVIPLACIRRGRPSLSTAMTFARLPTALIRISSFHPDEQMVPLSRIEGRCLHEICKSAPWTPRSSPPKTSRSSVQGA